MAPSTLDLLMLTCNCGKNLINVPIFAGHLQAAFGNNATGLPDLVVFSLQEVAPLSYSFIGGSFLDPYIARFEQAVNLAAIQHVEDEQEVISVTPTQENKKHYSLVRHRNVGYTAILLFARDPTRVQQLQEAEVGFGAAEMGNKGAVAFRAMYEDGEQRSSTEVTFVATHLAAMEWNLARRNANWGVIMRALTFQDPEKLVESFRHNGGGNAGSRGESESDSGEESPLLQGDDGSEEDEALQRQIHDISVFKPSSYLFLGGDLNYRISTTSPGPNATFPSLEPGNENFYTKFLPLDQLTRERTAGRTMHGLTEAEVRFPPTYKYDTQKGGPKGDVVSWKFASHRWPAWTDRILYLDLPSWLTSKQGGGGGGGNVPPPEIDVRAYDAFPVIPTSDHRPVYFRASVPLISPSAMQPPPGVRESATPGTVEFDDPRVRLPVEIDPEAWGRRAAARRREVMAGWSMFLWSTEQGAWILATLAVASLGAYWLYRAA